MFNFTYRIGIVPFFRISLGTAVGVFLESYFPNYLPSFIYGLVFLVLLFMCFLLFYLSKLHPKFGQFNPILLWMLCISFGVVISFYSSTFHANSFFANEPNKSKAKYLKLRIEELPRFNGKNWKAMASVVSFVDSNGAVFSSSGKILIYVKANKDSCPAQLDYGNIVLVKNNSASIQKPMLPGGFDYATTMKRKDVAYQIFAKSYHIIKIGEEPNLLIKWSYYCRNILNAKLLNLFSKRVGGTLASLLIGARDNLEEGDVKAFSQTGTIHVLAVSGMHVGLIYASLLFMLNFGKKTKRNAVFKSIVLMLAIWAYAYVTGLGASIVRATIMFTIIEIGKSFLRKKGNNYNAVFISMFLQMLYEPQVIYDLGFQLSYLAVFGILFLYEPIYRLWPIHNKWLNNCWKLSAISIAATLATMPVTISVFGTFPVWFLLANLIVVPLSSLLIYLGIFVLCLGSIPILGQLLIWICEKTMLLFLEITKLISKLPGNMEGIQWSALEGLMFLLCIFFLSYFIWFKRQKLYFYLSLTALCLFASISSFLFLYVQSRSEVLNPVYKQRRFVLIKEAEKVLVLLPNQQMLNDSVFRKQCLPYFKNNQTQSVEWRIWNHKTLNWQGFMLFINESSGLDGKCLDDFRIGKDRIKVVINPSFF